jgi:uncharacterized membrane protein HdeD (DUF308 family)
MKGVQSWFAAVLGAVLLFIGILGFINDPVLGLLSVNNVQNLIHLLSGVAGIIIGVWVGTAASRWFNSIFGIIYGFVALFGFFGIGVSLLDLNLADNLLHLLIALAAIGVGFSGKD